MTSVSSSLPPVDQPRPRRTAFRWVLDIVLFGVAVWLLSIVWRFNTGDLRAVQIEGVSMEPTLVPGDRLLARADRDAALQRNDLVIVLAPDKMGADLIKRLVGLPGDKVEVRNFQLYVNGVFTPPPNGVDVHPGTQSAEWVLGPDDFFVAGDNRERSDDSVEFGPVSRKSIVGRVFFRYSPQARWGSVE
jgi:signal peptidase I